MGWKPSEADDYYDRLLMTVMMEAAAAATPNDGGSPGRTGTESVGSNCISSSTANSPGTCSGGNASPTDCGRNDTTVSDDSKSLLRLQSQQVRAEGVVTATPTNAGPAVAASVTATTTTVAAAPSSSQHIHLWQFLKELLTASTERTASQDDASAGSPSPPPSSAASSTSSAAECSPQPTVSAANDAAGNKPQQQMIRWLDRKEGVFKIEDSQAVARLWGLRKKRPAMNYDKLSRSLRQYYKKKIMQKTERSQRLVYQFCPPYNA